MEPPANGDRVREIVTGREGIVTGCVEYLWGCQQCLVYIDGQYDDKLDPKAEWLDVNRLEVTERGHVQALEYASPVTAVALSGADRPAPVR